MRIVLFPLLLLDPIGFLIVYVAYVGLEIILWMWTKRQDSLLIVILSPLYGMFNTIARFVSFPLWIKNRFEFIFKKKHHLRVPGRNFVVEYSLITLVILTLLGYALYRFPYSILQ